MVRSAKQQANLTLLIDADIPAYQHASAGQRVYNWSDDPEDVSVAVDDVALVCEQFDDEVDRLRRKFHASAVVCCLTDGDNFRKRILPTYKGNRRVKPVLLPEVRAHIHATHKTFQKPSLEGDDVMGILATHPSLIPGEKLIVSIDKDMKTIPGTVYNGRKDELQIVTREQADYYHLFQTLVGDPTDNYKGCPGVGKVNAARILAQEGDPWDHIVAAFAGRGLTEADALVQARVARILRHTDYNFKTKEPILWNPAS